MGKKALIGFTWLLTVLTAGASVPGVFTYQGNMYDASGNPIADGGYDIRISIYDTPTGGIALNSRTLRAVLVTNGFFFVEIDNFADLFSQHEALWIETAADLDSPANGIQSDEVYSPRQRITAVPFSQEAGNSVTLEGAPRGSFFEKGDIDVWTTGPNGNDNVSLSNFSNTPNHGAIFLSDANNDDKVEVYASSSNVGVVRTYGSNGSGNVSLSNFPSTPNHGAIFVSEASNFYRASLSVNALNVGVLETYGSNDRLNALILNHASSTNHGWMSVHDSAGINRAGMYVDESGFGRVFSDFTSFVQKHPTKKDAHIVYVSLEGPEAGMYHRGRVKLEAGRATIEMPEHFAALASPDTMTVQLTPRSLDSKGLAVSEISADTIEIGELLNGTGSYEVHFIIHAVRKGYEDHDPVISDEEYKSAYTPGGLSSKKAGDRPERASRSR